jgi:hypothetical protein
MNVRQYSPISIAPIQECVHSGAHPLNICVHTHVTVTKSVGFYILSIYTAICASLMDKGTPTYGA